MAVSIDKVREEFAGDNVTVAFNTTLLATAADQVRVWDLDETLVPAVPTELLLGIGCTSTLNTPASLPSTLTVDVTFAYPTGLPVDHTLIVVRQNDLLQDETFVPGDRWPDAAVELILDKAVLQAQYAKWLAGRAFRVPIEDPDTLDLEAPNVTDRAGKIATYGALGEPSAADLSTLSPGTVVLSALAQVLLVSNSASVWRGTLSVVERFGSWLKSGSGTEAAKPSTVAFGAGVYFATDTRLLWFSGGGGSWIDITITQVANASFPAPSIAGKLVLNTDQKQLKRDNGASFDLIRSLPPNHLSGCGVSYTTTTTATVAAGWARDFADTLNMRLASSMVKSMNAAGSWTAGAAGNACPAGSVFAANTWYGVFLISKTDGTTDWGVDTSTTAANLLAAAAGYTLYRRIGYVRSNAVPNLIEWIQDGDDFHWQTPQLSYSNTAQNYTARTLLTLTHAPPSVQADCNVSLLHAAAADVSYVFHRTDQADIAPSATTGSLRSLYRNVSGGGEVDPMNAGQILLYPDASRQVYIRASGTTATDLYISVHGWRDTRGRDS